MFYSTEETTLLDFKPFLTDNEVVQSTLGAVPNRSSLFKTLRAPFSIVVKPFHEQGTRHNQLIRCKKCGAYYNQQVKLLGSRYQCSICFSQEELLVPPPTIEGPINDFIAGSEYVSQNKQRIHVVLIEATYSAIHSGVTACVSTLLSTLREQFQGQSVVLLTFNEVLQLFRRGTENEMYVVKGYTELAQSCIQVQDESFPLGSLLENIDSHFTHKTNTNNFYSSLLFLQGLARSYQLTIHAFVQSMPAELSPPVYKKIAAELAELRSSFTAYSFLAPESDLTPFSQLASATGGLLCHYSSFDAENEFDCQKLRNDFVQNLSGLCTDAVVRVRTSVGVSVSRYYGNFCMRSSDLLGYAAFYKDTALCAELIVDDDLSECFIQVAVLHTRNGERLIRTIDIVLPVTDNSYGMYSTVSSVPFVHSIVLSSFQKNSVEAMRAYCVTALVDFISGYYVNSKSVSRGSLSQNSFDVSLPKQLSSVAALTLGALKSLVLRDGTSQDMRVYAHSLVRSGYSPLLYYPALVELNATLLEKTPTSILELDLLRLNSSSVSQTGAYVLCNGLQIVIYVGGSVQDALVDALFGGEISGKVVLKRLGNPYNDVLLAVCSLFVGIKSMETYVVRENSDQSLRRIFFSNMVEDQNSTQPSYVEFIRVITERVLAKRS